MTADIISTVEFNYSGDLLATGDKGGRVVIFQREQEVSKLQSTDAMKSANPSDSALIVHNRLSKGTCASCVSARCHPTIDPRSSPHALCNSLEGLSVKPLHQPQPVVWLCRVLTAEETWVEGAFLLSASSPRAALSVREGKVPSGHRPGRGPQVSLTHEHWL